VQVKQEKERKEREDGRKNSSWFGWFSSSSTTATTVYTLRIVDPSLSVPRLVDKDLAPDLSTKALKRTKDKNNYY
jgi:hypothetical protein